MRRKERSLHSLSFGQRALSIHHSCDAAIVDGSLAGIGVALALSRAGHRTAVIARRTYLGREITATLRPSLRASASTLPSALPGPLAACPATCGPAPQEAEAALHLDAGKPALDDLLLEAGVQLLHVSVPVGLVVQVARVEVFLEIATRRQNCASLPTV